MIQHRTWLHARIVIWKSWGDSSHISREHHYNGESGSRYLTVRGTGYSHYEFGCASTVVKFWHCGVLVSCGYNWMTTTKLQRLWWCSAAHFVWTGEVQIRGWTSCHCNLFILTHVQNFHYGRFVLCSNNCGTNEFVWLCFWDWAISNVLRW